MAINGNGDYPDFYYAQLASSRVGIFRSNCATILLVLFAWMIALRSALSTMTLVVAFFGAIALLNFLTIGLVWTDAKCLALLPFLK